MPLSNGVLGFWIRLSPTRELPPGCTGSVFLCVCCCWNCLTLEQRKFTRKHSVSNALEIHPLVLKYCLSGGSAYREPACLEQSPLQITCGTKQGCAFSLVLFIGTLRPLITIKNNDAIKIIQIRDNQFQLPLPGDGIMDSVLSSALLKDSSSHSTSIPHQTPELHWELI